MKTNLERIEPYITRDGSEIRELLHPDLHACRNQSLAEARVAPGQATALHRHGRSEEIYHVLAGTGLMTLGLDSFPVGPGDSVLIAPGTPHRIENTGTDVLRVLCACAPAYSHADTELL